MHESAFLVDALPAIQSRSLRELLQDSQEMPVRPPEGVRKQVGRAACFGPALAQRLDEGIGWGNGALLSILGPEAPAALAVDGKRLVREVQIAPRSEANRLILCSREKPRFGNRYGNRLSMSLKTNELAERGGFEPPVEV